MNNQLITIGYSSLANRVEKICLPPAREGVEILIAVQGGIAQDLQREDVRIIYLDSIGAAKSRNIILTEANGKILFFGDDDMKWVQEGVEEVVHHFSCNDDVDLVLGQSFDENSNLRKRYFRNRKRLSRFNSAKAATYEIAIRTESFRGKEIAFDENFGAGTANYLGDEYIFIADACSKGLSCEFIPATVAIHPLDSSGTRFGTSEDARARSLVFQKVFGALAPLARLGFVLKNPMRFKKIALILRFVFGEFPKEKSAEE